MKKASLIYNVVLTIAVIVLFVLHFTSKSGKSPSSLGSETSIAPAGSIVFIQLDTLLNKYDMFNDKRSELESKVEAVKDELSKKNKAFERDLTDFNEKIQKGLITRAQAESLQSQLQVRQQELQNLSQQKEYEMREEEAVLLRNVGDLLDKYLKKYNLNKKYSLILTTTGVPGSVVQGDSTFNITNEVVKGMNEEYIKERNNKK
jgi:outer membrane protein